MDWLERENSETCVSRYTGAMIISSHYRQYLQDIGLLYLIVGQAM